MAPTYQQVSPDEQLRSFMNVAESTPSAADPSGKDRFGAFNSIPFIRPSSSELASIPVATSRVYENFTERAAKDNLKVYRAYNFAMDPGLIPLAGMRNLFPNTEVTKGYAGTDIYADYTVEKSLTDVTAADPRVTGKVHPWQGGATLLHTKLALAGTKDSDGQYTLKRAQQTTWIAFGYHWSRLDTYVNFDADRSPVERKIVSEIAQLDQQMLKVQEGAKMGKHGRYVGNVTHFKGEYILSGSAIIEKLTEDVKAAPKGSPVFLFTASATPPEAKEKLSGLSKRKREYGQLMYRFYETLQQKHEEGSFVLFSPEHFHEAKDKAFYESYGMATYRSNVHTNLYFVRGAKDEGWIMYMTDRRITAAPQESQATRITEKEYPEFVHAMMSGLVRQGNINPKDILKLREDTAKLDAERKLRKEFTKQIVNAGWSFLIDKERGGSIAVPSKIQESYFYGLAIRNLTMTQMGMPGRRLDGTMEGPAVALWRKSALSAPQKIIEAKAQELAIGHAPRALTHFDMMMTMPGYGTLFNEAAIAQGITKGPLLTSERSYLASFAAGIGGMLDSSIAYNKDFTQSSYYQYMYGVQQTDVYKKGKDGPFATAFGGVVSFAEESAVAIISYLHIAYPLAAIGGRIWASIFEGMVNVGASDHAPGAAQLVRLFGGMGLPRANETRTELLDRLSARNSYTGLANYDPYYFNNAFVRKPSALLWSSVRDMIMYIMSPYRPGSAEYQDMHDLGGLLGDAYRHNGELHVTGELARPAELVLPTKNPLTGEYQGALVLQNVGMERAKNLARLLDHFLDHVPINPLLWSWGGLNPVDAPRRDFRSMKEVVSLSESLTAWDEFFDGGRVSAARHYVEHTSMMHEVENIGYLGKGQNGEAIYEGGWGGALSYTRRALHRPIVGIIDMVRVGVHTIAGTFGEIFDLIRSNDRANTLRGPATLGEQMKFLYPIVEQEMKGLQNAAIAAENTRRAAAGDVPLDLQGEAQLRAEKHWRYDAEAKVLGHDLAIRPGEMGMSIAKARSTHFWQNLRGSYIYMLTDALTDKGVGSAEGKIFYTSNHGALELDLMDDQGQLDLHKVRLFNRWLARVAPIQERQAQAAQESYTESGVTQAIKSRDATATRQSLGRSYHEQAALARETHIEYMPSRTVWRGRLGRLVGLGALLGHWVSVSAESLMPISYTNSQFAQMAASAQGRVEYTDWLTEGQNVEIRGSNLVNLADIMMVDGLFGNMFAQKGGESREDYERRYAETARTLQLAQAMTSTTFSLGAAYVVGKVKGGKHMLSVGASGDLGRLLAEQEASFIAAAPGAEVKGALQTTYGLLKRMSFTHQTEVGGTHQFNIRLRGARQGFNWVAFSIALFAFSEGIPSLINNLGAGVRYASRLIKNQFSMGPAAYHDRLLSMNAASSQFLEGYYARVHHTVMTAPDTLSRTALEGGLMARLISKNLDIFTRPGIETFNKTKGNMYRPEVKNTAIASQAQTPALTLFISLVSKRGRVDPNDPKAGSQGPRGQLFMNVGLQGPMVLGYTFSVGMPLGIELRRPQYGALGMGLIYSSEDNNYLEYISSAGQASFLLEAATVAAGVTFGAFTHTLPRRGLTSPTAFSLLYKAKDWINRGIHFPTTLLYLTLDTFASAGEVIHSQWQHMAGQMYYQRLADKTHLEVWKAQQAHEKLLNDPRAKTAQIDKAADNLDRALTRQKKAAAILNQPLPRRPILRRGGVGTLFSLSTYAVAGIATAWFAQGQLGLEQGEEINQPKTLAVGVAIGLGYATAIDVARSAAGGHISRAWATHAPAPLQAMAARNLPRLGRFGLLAGLALAWGFLSTDERFGYAVNTHLDGDPSHSAHQADIWSTIISTGVAVTHLGLAYAAGFGRTLSDDVLRYKQAHTRVRATTSRLEAIGQQLEGRPGILKGVALHLERMVLNTAQLWQQSRVDAQAHTIDSFVKGYSDLFGKAELVRDAGVGAPLTVTTGKRADNRVSSAADLMELDAAGRQKFLAQVEGFGMSNFRMARAVRMGSRVQAFFVLEAAIVTAVSGAAYLRNQAFDGNIEAFYDDVSNGRNIPIFGGLLRMNVGGTHERKTVGDALVGIFKMLHLAPDSPRYSGLAGGMGIYQVGGPETNYQTQQLAVGEHGGVMKYVAKQHNQIANSGAGGGIGATKGQLRKNSHRTTELDILSRLGYVHVIDAPNSYMPFPGMGGYTFRASELDNRGSFYYQIQAPSFDFSMAEYSVSAKYFFDAAIGGRDQVALMLQEISRAGDHTSMETMGAYILYLTASIPMRARARIVRTPMSRTTVELINKNPITQSVLIDRTRAMQVLSYQTPLQMAAGRLRTTLSKLSRKQLQQAYAQGSLDGIKDPYTMKQERLRVERVMEFRLNRDTETLQGRDQEMSGLTPEDMLLEYEPSMYGRPEVDPSFWGQAAAAGNRVMGAARGLTNLPLGIGPIFMGVGIAGLAAVALLAFTVANTAMSIQGGRAEAGHIQETLDWYDHASTKGRGPRLRQLSETLTLKGGASQDVMHTYAQAGRYFYHLSPKLMAGLDPGNVERGLQGTASLVGHHLKQLRQNIQVTALRAPGAHNIALSDIFAVDPQGQLTVEQLKPEAAHPMYDATGARAVDAAGNELWQPYRQEGGRLVPESVGVPLPEHAPYASEATFGRNLEEALMGPLEELLQRTADFMFGTKGQGGATQSTTLVSGGHSQVVTSDAHLRRFNTRLYNPIAAEEMAGPWASEEMRFEAEAAVARENWLNITRERLRGSLRASLRSIVNIPGFAEGRVFDVGAIIKDITSDWWGAAGKLFKGIFIGTRNPMSNEEKLLLTTQRTADYVYAQLAPDLKALHAGVGLDTSIYPTEMPRGVLQTIQRQIGWIFGVRPEGGSATSGELASTRPNAVGPNETHTVRQQTGEAPELHRTFRSGVLANAGHLLNWISAGMEVGRFTNLSALSANLNEAMLDPSYTDGERKLRAREYVHSQIEGMFGFLGYAGIVLAQKLIGGFAGIASIGIAFGIPLVNWASQHFAKNGAPFSNQIETMGGWVSERLGQRPTYLREQVSKVGGVINEAVSSLGTWVNNTILKTDALVGDSYVNTFGPRRGDTPEANRNRALVGGAVITGANIIAESGGLFAAGAAIFGVGAAFTALPWIIGAVAAYNIAGYVYSALDPHGAAATGRNVRRWIQNIPVIGKWLVGEGETGEYGALLTRQYWSADDVMRPISRETLDKARMTELSALHQMAGDATGMRFTRAYAGGWLDSRTEYMHDKRRSRLIDSNEFLTYTFAPHSMVDSIGQAVLRRRSFGLSHIIGQSEWQRLVRTSSNRAEAQAAELTRQRYYHGYLKGAHRLKPSTQAVMRAAAQITKAAIQAAMQAVQAPRNANIQVPKKIAQGLPGLVKGMALKGQGVPVVQTEYVAQADGNAITTWHLPTMDNPTTRASAPGYDPTYALRRGYG